MPAARQAGTYNSVLAINNGLKRCRPLFKDVLMIARDVDV
jgi:hypothetical protein